MKVDFGNKELRTSDLSIGQTGIIVQGNGIFSGDLVTNVIDGEGNIFLINLTKNKIIKKEYICTLVDVKIVKDEG